jgi:GNAT superfamily N-acetyltransferase
LPAEENCSASEIVLIEELPAPEEYLRLRQAVGWTLPLPEVVRDSLPNSLYCVCARERGVIVGMARVIGDGGLVYYIQDLIVDPARQGEGIGRRMMDRVMDYIRRHATHHAIVGLMAARGKEPFYERYGFTRRPDEKLGAGMTIFWDAENPS